MRLFRRVPNTAVILFLSAAIGGGAIVLGQGATQEFLVEKVIVFPDEIEAVGWRNVETIVNQNVDGNGLYQDFGRLNSAYIEREEARDFIDAQVRQLQSNPPAASVSSDPAEAPTGAVIEVPVENTIEATSTTGETAGNSAATTTVITPSPESVEPLTNDALEPVVEDDVLEPLTETEEIEAEEAEPSPELSPSVPEEPISFLQRFETKMELAFRTFTARLPFAQFSSTSPITDPDTQTADESEVVDQVAFETPSSSTDESNDSGASSTTSLPAIVTTTIATTTDVTDVPTEESGASSTVAVPVVLPQPTADVLVDEVIEPTTSTPLETTVGESSTTESVSTTTAERLECTGDCGEYTIVMGGFSLPLFDDGRVLDGAQLRLSMAAKRDLRKLAEIQTLDVAYSLDSGVTWFDGAQYLIEDEIANSINGGHFLVGLPQITNEAALDTLQIKITFNGDPRDLEGLYIDSAWVELITVTPTSIDPVLSLADFESGFDPEPLQGDSLVIDTGEEITFDFTDENTNETLIIKSDERDYVGLSKTTTYFNVTNTSNSEDTFTLNTYFSEGVGDVVLLEEWNQNKPTEVVIPEYRPFVYHCDAGWEVTNLPVSHSVLDFSRLFSPETDDLDEDLLDTSTTSVDTGSTSTESTTTDTITPEVIQTETTSTDGSNDTTGTILDDVTVPSASPEDESGVETATDTPDVVSTILRQSQEFMQASAIIPLGTSSEEAVISDEESEALRYVCRETSVVRECDSVEGENTDCRLDQVKIDEQVKTSYSPGWERVEIAPGTPADTRGFFRRAKDFLGLGPDKKDIPKPFEARAHSAESFTIAPGETKYFKMEISFPPLSEGEYWIEAVGTREYGLLDPFWASDWDFRMPITIDNTNGTTDLTEYQVFLELTSSLTDFWSNVASDGSDIRFAQQVSSSNFSNAGTAVNNWWDLAFGRRIPVVVPALTVEEDFSDLPISIDLSTFDSEFWNNVKSDGGDIRVTNSAGEELPVDIGYIDTATQIGDLHFLADEVVRAGASTFYIYFDNAGASLPASTDPFGRNAVWVDYEAVYHFSDDPTAISNVVTDATGNGHDVVVVGAALATTTGKFGLAFAFGGVGGYLQDTTWLFGAGDPLITSGVFKMSAPSNEAIWQWGTGAQPNELEFRPWYQDANPLSADGVHFFGVTGGATYARSIATSTWHAFATVGTTSVGGINLVYEDTVLIESVTQNIANPSNTNAAGFQIGREGAGGSWVGTLDELRIATSSLSDARIRAENQILFDAGTYLSIAAVQVPDNAPNLSWYSTSWNQRTAFTIPQNSVADDLTDFPVYLDLALLGPNFFSGVATDGRDIRITLGDGVTEVPHELVAINTGAQTGELYFKTDLFASAANEFYVYYDNEDALAYADSDTYGTHNVWTNGFRAVYHFEEDAAGISNFDVYTDSTSNQYHGDDFNASTGKDGLFGRGQAFADTVQTDYISLPREVLNGVGNLTTSWWHRTTTAGAQAIVSGANATQFNEYITFFNNQNNFQLHYQGGNEPFALSDTIADHATGDWNYFVATGEDALDEVNFYVNGVGDTENPDPQPIDPLSIATGGLIVGQEQDALGGGFSSTDNFEGDLDELRFATVIRSAAWIETEYTNMGDVGSFIATSTSETLAITDFVELDFWLQHFDSSAEEADIWVQVASLPAGEETTIYMYYGSSGATSASDEFATFSYSTSTEIFHVVDSNANLSQISVVSLIDNNEVRLNAGSPVSLNRGERTTFSSFTGAATLSVLGPISGTITSTGGDGSDTIVPIGFASTTHVIPTFRGTETWYVKAPFATAGVQTFIAAAGTPTQSATTTVGTVTTFSGTNPGSSQGAVITANRPVLVTQRTTTPQDGLVSYPPTRRDIFGVYSNTIYISALASNSDPLVTCSGGGSATVTGITRGEAQSVTTCTNGAEGAGDAVRFRSQANGITAIQQADSDGNESTVFWPRHEFGTRYAMTNNTAYVAIVCAPRFGATTLEIQDATGATVSVGSCTPTGNNPGKAYFNNGNGTDGDAINYPAGYQVVSTNGVPFYAIYEDVTGDFGGNGDEKNIVGSVQARKYDGIERSGVFGAQEPAELETFDEDIEQLSFAWYQNTANQTPASRWLLSGSETVFEGEAISGSGAVEQNDILRVRMNAAFSLATTTAGTRAFSLQYGAAPAPGQCSLVTEWSDIGAVGDTNEIFSGYDNATVADGSTLATTTLAASTYVGTYEERNFSDFIPTDIPPGGVVEWDWVLQANEVAINTTYCFRLVRATRQPLTTYTAYPELITVGPPNTPTNLTYFDNEHTVDTTPVLTFISSDLANDDIHYRVQISADHTFATTLIDRNSDDNFLNFENVANPSDKAPFTSGQIVRFTSPTALATGTTYWYRVQASDPAGSATTSAWSTPTSFTVNDTLATSEWYQTTAAQFSTNVLSSVATSSGQVSVVGSLGTMVGTGVDFDDAVVGNAWAEADWNDTETSGEIRVQVQYNNNGAWQLVPDTFIPGNSVGTSTAPINLRDLDTSTFNELRLVATFDGATLSLQDWTIRWGLRVETPVLGDPFDNEKLAPTLPEFDFVSNDPQLDPIEYELSISTDQMFTTSSSTFNSSVDPGFEDVVTSTTTSPFTSGNRVRYTAQSALSNGTTYWWRVRAKDPTGDNVWSPWSLPDSFTVDTAVTLSTWFQTTHEQFLAGVLDGATASSGAVQVAANTGEYGTITVTNGVWTEVETQLTYNNPVVVTSIRYDRTTDAQRTSRVRNKSATSFEVRATNYDNSISGSTVIDYIVVEAGDYDIEGGARLVAGTETVTAVANRALPTDPGGSTVTFSPAFAADPVVLTSIVTDNDPDWAISSVYSGTNKNNPPSTSQLRLFLNLVYNAPAVHGAEDIDYIAFELGHGTNGTSEYDVTTSGGNNVTDSVFTLPFSSAFSSTPQVAVVQSLTNTGGDGGFAVHSTNVAMTTTNIRVAIDEDGFNGTLNADRGHGSAERVGVVAFENASGLIKRDDGLGLSGTIAGEDIIFSDGAGPKFDNFSWVDSTPGASEILYQIQYQVSEGVYALIPNSVIPGNSVGTTTSPIDLTGVDIALYPVIRPFATLSCSGGNCPEIQSWQVEWSEGVSMSGTLQEYDRTTSVATGTIRAAVNGVPVAGSASVSGGVWTLPNVTAFAGNTVTVWVDGADEADEAVSVFVYDGIGDITGVALYEQHLAIDANENTTVTNVKLSAYDNSISGNEDIFFNVDALNNLTVCAVGACDNANLYIGGGNVYIPATTSAVTVTTHDVVNDGTLTMSANTFNVSGSWLNAATTTPGTSQLNLTAATGTETIVSPGTTQQFHSVSFGAGAGNAVFALTANLDLSGNLTVASGTLNRATSTINLAGNLTTGAAGFWVGSASTTFDGAGAKTWRDDNPVTQFVGDVLIDGAVTVVTAQTDVGAYDVRIGTNDTLVGSVGNTIFVGGDWRNAGTFTAQSGIVEIVNDDREYPPIVPGSQDWYADSNFDSRVMLSIDPVQVTGDQNNFPIYVNLRHLGNSFWSDVAVDGRDIRVTSGDGQTELPIDLVSINTTSKTGELYFLADSVDSATTTYFFIYFDNPGATAYAESDPYGRNAVWVDYEAVYHFEDDPTAIDNLITDATGNGRNLVVEEGALATTTGQLGLGINLDGTGLLSDPGFNWNAGDPLFTSGWYFMTGARNEALWQFGEGAEPHQMYFEPWDSGTTRGQYQFGNGAGTTYDISPRNTTIWHHFSTIGATSTSASNFVYEDGILRETQAQTVANPENTSLGGFQVGRNGGTGNRWIGQIDELRISSILRDATWIETEYNNQRTPTAFYATSTRQSYVPDLVIDEATHTITTNGSSFFTLRLNDATTTPAFTESTVVVNGNFEIATGTVSLPTAKLTVGGSFLNNGTFMHNNGQVEFIGTGSKTIQLQGTAFLNALYDVRFNGAGSWSFTDTNATTSRNFLISNGAVTFPSGQLTVGGVFTVSGAGTFAHNNGTVQFISDTSAVITPRTSSFNNVIFGVNNQAEGWYGLGWGHRAEVALYATEVTEDLTNFPVYIDLSLMDATFWSNVASQGQDLRMTTSDGVTEIPLEVVSIDTGAETGEIHFLAPFVSSLSDTRFYLYFDNPDATPVPATDPYGSQAVWAEFEAVYHFDTDPLEGIVDETGRGRDLSTLVGTPVLTAGLMGGAIDMTTSNTMVGNTSWTWPAGYNLTSSGLYFQSAVDTGALWQFGTTCVADTCIAFMPWYDAVTRGYHRFGETGSNDYFFARDNTVWHHFTTLGRVTAGDVNRIYEDAVLRDSYVQTVTGENPTQTGLQIGRYTTGTYMNIQIDELRFASTSRSVGWITTENNNLRNNASFATTSSESYLEAVTSFTLAGTNVTAVGDVTIYGSNVIAPSGNFSIGGSALNSNGSFNPNNGTVVFNSTDVGETVEFGTGAFNNLTFNGVGGGWTIATTTAVNNVSLLNGADFTLASGTTLTVGGIFTNELSAANTTWASTTLVLSGGDYVVTDRLESGDSYETIVVEADSDITIWNSSITRAVTRDNSSLYLPDYANTNGVLRIYGEYTRSSGTEHWSYATDFDGTALTGGNERPVAVEIGRGSSLYFATGTTLSMLGASGNETTVASISGIYLLQSNAGTVAAEYVSLSNVGPRGLYLTGGTVLSSFTEVDFNVPSGRSGLTVDADTMNAQPSSEFSAIDFATSSANSVYDAGWTGQLVITIPSSALLVDIENYPLYVDLSTLGADFWAGVASDGRDIRVTTGNGAELPIDLVEINTATQTGELHFLAPILSANADTTYFIHYNNPAAVAYQANDEFGANAVWAAYEAVYHFHEDPSVRITDMSGNGRDLTPLVGVPATTTGLLGTALDLTSSNVMLGNVLWTWPAGDDLVTSGLYFQTAVNTGALWQFGNACPTDNCLAFMPWYDAGTRGWHRFGETTGNDYSFTRNNTIWHHFTTIGRATDGEAVEIFEDSVLRDTYNQTSTGENPSQTGLQIGRYNGGAYVDMDIDELRITTTIPTDEWRELEYLNLTDPTALYATGTSPDFFYNVTVEGAPATFWKFVLGGGDLFGEDFDNDDGNPGSIQWDNSNFEITIAGTVYADDGVTPQTYPVCNGSTEVVTIVLDGVDTYQTACDPLDGSYELTGISYVGTPQLTAYIDSSATAPQTNVSIYDELTGTGTIASNLMSVVRPTVVDDSVLVLIAGKDDEPLWAAPPAGWVSLNQLGNTTGDDIASGVWYKVVSDAGVEPASYDFTVVDNGEGFSYWMGTLLNVDTTTPVDVASVWSKLQDQQFNAAPSITTVTNGALVLAAWYVYADDEIVPPRYDWDMRADNVVGNDPAPGNNLTVVSRSQRTAGATPSATSTGLISGRESQVGQFAFRPATNPTASSSVTAAVVSKTPIGNLGSPFEVVSVRDQRIGYGTVAATSDFTVDRPAVEDGDVLVAVMGKEDDFAINAPAGWVLAADRLESAGFQMYTAVWYKVITNAASEPTSYTFTSTDTSVEEYSYWVGSFVGVDTTDIFNIDPVWSNQQNTATPIAPSITTTTSGAYALAAWYAIDEATFDMPGVPWTTLAQDAQNNNRNLLLAGRSMVTPGSTGAATITGGGATDDANVVQFALQPAPISVRTSITDFDLYQNRLILRHEDSDPITIADIAVFDNTDNSDLPYTASTSSSPDLLTVLAGTGLVVFDDRTFVPGGEIVLSGTGTNGADGSLLLNSDSTLTLGSDDLTIGGSYAARAGAVFTPGTADVFFTATNPGQSISTAASSTVTFNRLSFTGVGGGWAVQTPVISNTSLTVATGTLSGVANITIENGNFSGNGTVAMNAGTVQVSRTNTFGGSTPWSFHNLTLGNGTVTGITAPAGTATTTVNNVLRISAAHFLDAGNARFDLRGTGTPFVRNGTFLQDTSTVRYSASGTATVLATSYYNLVLNAAAGTGTYRPGATGFQVFNDLVIGGTSTSTADFNTNDPVVSVANDVRVRPNGILQASNSALLTVLGSWNNAGTLTANGGTITFSTAGTETITTGGDAFGVLNLTGLGTISILDSATTTGNLTINNGGFTQQSGTSLAVGGTFSNLNATGFSQWSGTTVHLFSGTAYQLNPKTTANQFNTLVVSNGTQPRLWNSRATTTSVLPGSSVYSRDHAGVDGSLYIFGDYRNTSFTDVWSHARDFDDTVLGSPRPVTVRVSDGGSVLYTGGTLRAIGASTASTTIQNQGSGTFDFRVGGTASVQLQYYVLRNLTPSGLTLSGTPTVVDLSNGDFLIDDNGDSGITVGGTVIEANPALNFNRNIFASSTGITGFNVTATGTTLSAWRFANESGSLAGEAFDNDPGGNPGYIAWSDSDAIISISGNVYSDEGSSVSTVCDSTTNVITLVVAGIDTYQTSCNGDGLGGGTGAYTISGVTFNSNDTLTVYIDGQTEKAVTVSADPLANISDMDLYENRVIVRHEAATPLTIADMSVWEDDDDPDVVFDTTGGNLTLPADFKLIVWNNKQFTPGGSVTIPGGGSGNPYDGTLELFAGSRYTTGVGQTHTIGGSLISGASAEYRAGNATTTFTTTGAGRTVDVNNVPLGTARFTGSGSWTITDTTFRTHDSLIISAGAVTLPTGTTTIGNTFNSVGGAFTANNGILRFNATNTGNVVAFGGSPAHQVQFVGTGGSWTMTDTNATTTANLRISAGTVTLPSGTLSVNGSFEKLAGSFAHNNGTVRLTGGVTNITARSSDFNNLTLAGAGPYTMTDSSVALLGDLSIVSGALTLATNTVSIGGSLDAVTGTFNHSSGTVLFNSADTGETVTPGSSSFYNVVFANSAGGWTVAGNATTTNNFTLSNANTFILGSGNTLRVGGVFTNNVGGTATTWTGSTVILPNNVTYQISPKTIGTELYETLQLGTNSDIRSWQSSATTLLLPTGSSFYSQDHAGVNGALRIYGDYQIGTTTEYWSFATDFDGAALGGGSRAVAVTLVDAATSSVSVTGGTLRIIGTAAATTTIASDTGTYTVSMTGGTFNASYYDFSDLGLSGVSLLGATNITSLSNGRFTLGVNSGAAITLASTTLDANPSLIINNTDFFNGGFSGTNVSLDATTTNSWRFTNGAGSLYGEDFDIDGTDACGSIRFEDSECLLIEQTGYRWRNDDGGLGVPDSEWFDTNWDKRKQIRIKNNDNVAYATTSVLVTVAYDADMQANFSDLRFTNVAGVELDYWIEKNTPSSEALIWVEINSLPAAGFTPVYMYYDNPSATVTTSSSTATMVVVEDFEDGSLSEYTGNTGLFSASTDFNFGGTFGLDTAGFEANRATDGIGRTDITVSQGQIISFRQYVDTVAGSSDEVCTLFGVQSVTGNTNYGVCLEQFGTDRLVLVENAESTDTFGGVSVLASKPVTFTTGWHVVEIDWQTNNDIDVTLYGPTGAVVGTTTANDSTYTSGGIGFTYWGQNGGWDSYTARQRVSTAPTVFIGAEQTDGGATWRAAQNTPLGNTVLGDPVRLRFAIENSGLAVSGEQFTLEYAAKGVAPSCGSVSSASYDPVPVAASCGLSDICMTTSSNFVDSEVTGDLLEDVEGVFTPGRAVEDPSNQTVGIDIDQRAYTEVEYVITPTINVTDEAYCLRVTKDGTPLDSYNNIAELTLQFTPSITNGILNDGFDIDLAIGATTTVFATATVSDLNGFSDLEHATATIFRSGVGPACTPNNNSCYVASGSACSFINCAGTSCTLSCQVDMYFHADPTDFGVYAGEEWFAYLEAEDMTGGYDFATTSGVELLTLRALNAVGFIDYGVVDVNANTGANNATTSIFNLGNESIDVRVTGTDLTDGAASAIPVSQQRLATSTFTYDLCTTCEILSATGTVLDVDLTKPVTDSPLVADDIYWGIAIPFGIASNPHSGVNFFEAVGD